MKKRSGMFFAEVMIAASLLAAAVSALLQVCGVGLAGSTRTTDNADAVRSALIAIEAIKSDTGRMVVQEDEDLSVAPDGRGFKLLVPARVAEKDPWGFDAVAVRWSLEPVPNTTERLYHLVRTAGGVARALPGCTLRDLKVRELESGTLGSGSFLDITVTAVGGPNSPTAVTLSFLAPLKLEGGM